MIRLTTEHTTLVEEIGEYQIRQCDTIATEHEGGIYPYSFLVTEKGAEDKSLIKLPDAIAPKQAIIAMCQTKQLARTYIEFLQGKHNVHDLLHGTEAVAH